MAKLSKLFKMFYTFAKVGLFTFGGGYAMLPMLQRELVDNQGWATEEELMDYYAIGQCTPGVIAVNVSTFVGYNQMGFLGAVFLIVLFVAFVMRGYTIASRAPDTFSSLVAYFKILNVFPCAVE